MFQHLNRIVAAARLGQVHDPVLAVTAGMTGMTAKTDGLVGGLQPYFSAYGMDAYAHKRSKVTTRAGGYELWHGRSQSLADDLRHVKRWPDGKRGYRLLGVHQRAWGCNHPQHPEVSVIGGSVRGSESLESKSRYPFGQAKRNVDRALNRIMAAGVIYDKLGIGNSDGRLDLEHDLLVAQGLTESDMFIERR